MWVFRKPSAAQIRDFQAVQSSQPFSYADVGASRNGAPPGYDLDHNRIELGKGSEVFEAACTALSRWQMFPPAWTEIHPADTLARTGNTVVMLARVMGVWWLNACRVVYVVDEAGPPRRFGFAYGTLPAHVESGEERFSIEWDADDRVWYDLRAFSRPHYWAVRLGYPLARRLQRRFVRDSQAAMRQAVANGISQTTAERRT